MVLYSLVLIYVYLALPEVIGENLHVLANMIFSNHIESEYPVC